MPFCGEACEDRVLLFIGNGYKNGDISKELGVISEYIYGPGQDSEVQR